MAKDDPTRLAPKPSSKPLTDKSAPAEAPTRLATQADEATVLKSADRLGSVERRDGDATSLAETAIGASRATVRTSTQSTQNSVFARLDQRVAQVRDPNSLLKDRFVLEKTLGAGGMGSVYLARDLLREEMEDSEPYIAIKVLNDDVKDLPGALQSLQREAKKAQTLSHPNIVTVYDFDRDGEQAFITMEYIKGEELKDYLRHAQRLSVKKAQYVIERIARGLAYAHQQGFVHSDIKPANIFLGADNTVKILDFGIAKAFTDASKEQKRTAADELTEGALTPSYASKEMLLGKPVMPSDDVYALAVMAYEMISGRHPFIGADGLPLQADIAEKQGAKMVPIPGVPRRLMRALRKGLAFNRSERFKDAGLFLEAIKPRNWKKDLSLVALVMALTGALIFTVNQGLEQVVPGIGSLKPELAEVASTLEEADALYKENEIAMAHRLYAQAWELASDLTVEDVTEREKVQAILIDRMNGISNALIKLSEDEGLSEYRLREISVALGFLLQDDIAGNERRIEKAIEKLQMRIKELTDSKG